MLNLIPNPHPLVFQLFAVSCYKWGARGLWIIRLPCSVGYTLFLLISTKLQVKSGNDRPPAMQTGYKYSLCTVHYLYKQIQDVHKCTCTVTSLSPQKLMFSFCYFFVVMCVFVLFLSVSLQCKDHHGVLSPPILWLSLCRNPGWHHIPHGHRIWRHVTRGPLLVQSKSIVSRSVPSSSLSCFQACNLLS